MCLHTCVSTQCSQDADYLPIPAMPWPFATLISNLPTIPFSLAAPLRGATRPRPPPALICRHLLPTIAARLYPPETLQWSKEHHTSFPPAFRAAARALLLTNQCRGFPATPAAVHEKGTCSGVQGRQRTVHLPADVLLLILQLAAHPPFPWLLQPALAEASQASCTRLPWLLQPALAQASQASYTPLPWLRLTISTLVVAATAVCVFRLSQSSSSRC
jgi:hypothetical protein